MNSKPSKAEREMFVKERLKSRWSVLLMEAKWAAGEAPPDGFKTPPEWVKRAILRHAQETPLPLGELNAFGELAPEMRGKILGFAEAGARSIDSPSETEKLNEEMNPNLKDLRGMFMPFAGAIDEFARKLRSGESSIGLPKSPGELKDFYEGARKAAEFISDEADRSMKAELCHWMWVFWPEVEGFQSRTKVHEWFGQMEFVNCSFKLFEKVCLELGYTPGSIG